MAERNYYPEYNILKSIAQIYHTMHIIDLVNNTAVPYNSDVTVDRNIDFKDGADMMMRKVMVANIDPAYLNACLEFSDLSTASERLRNNKIISAEFLGNNIGWIEASFISVEQDQDGNVTKVVFVTRNIDKVKRKEESLISQSNTDELTGAYNRRAYDDAIRSIREEGIADDFVYVAVDVNGLKVVNDSIGHNAGDELIAAASSSLVRSLGQYGKTYRTGGDEFVVLLHASEEQLKNAIALLDDVTEGWKGNLVDELSVSYGYVAATEKESITIQEMAILADQRMYEAKTLYYKRKGVDRKGQKEAHIALCALYTKILKINLTDDSYQIINMELSEQTQEKGFSNKISEWLQNFAMSGHVHPDDRDEYLEKTKISYLEDYFSQGKTSLHIFYRRMFEDGFKQVMMEIIHANDYSEENHSYFLYVKNIDR